MAGKDFQALQELVALVKNGRVREQDVIGSSGAAGSTKADELYAGISAQRFTSDEEAAAHFYDGNKNSSSYQKLKQTLYRRLVSTVFLLDVEQSPANDRQQAYHECNREWSAARIVLGQYAYTAGIRMCQKVLARARKYEFTDLVLIVLRVLRTHYGAQLGDQRQFNRYNKLYQEYQQIWLLETEAEELYTDLVLRHVKSKADRRLQLRRAQTYYQRLEPSLKKYNTYQLQLCGGLIRLMIAGQSADSTVTLRACDDMIRCFERKPYEASVPLQVAYYQKLICHTQLRQYREGKRVADKCRKLLPEGSFNWFKFQELSLIFLFHLQRYQEASELFLPVIRHAKFKTLPPVIQEIWKVFEGFLAYLCSLEKVRPAPGEKHFAKFRSGRFLNETPTFAQDKRGMNIPLLIIQFLMLIREGRYETAADRIEAIEKYSTRYLRKDETYRSNCFIKMLMEAPRGGFHRAAVMRKAAKHLERLKKMPLTLSNQAYEIEIIPYEDLWQLVLDSLDHRFRG